MSLPLLSSIARQSRRTASKAFTLVEMLVVMSVVALILGMSGPAVTALTGAGEVSSSVYDIAGILEQSRAYAMSNNTYVYVGFMESDGSKTAYGNKAPGSGRVNVAVIASKDGARGYDPNNASSWDAYAKDPNKSVFVTIGKVQHFNNLHLVNLGTPPTSGNMLRPTVPPAASKDSGSYNLGDDITAVTRFDYPLGAATAEYSFKKVIQFDPQGVARIQYSDNSDTIAKRMEIGLQQAHGSTVEALPTDKPVASGSIAAIQIDCMTGSTRIYRP